MRNRSCLLAFAALTACLTAPGCSSDEERSEPDLGMRLEADTKVRWAVGKDERSGEVRYLAPARPVRVGDGTPEEGARAFFARYRDALHGTSKPDELRPVPVVVDDDGSTRVRFEHYLPGTEIPVLDAASTAHFTADGELYWAQPGFRADLSQVGATPVITKEIALAVARSIAVHYCKAAESEVETGEPTLVVRADEDSPALLVWRVRMTTRTEECFAPEILVDASNGDLAGLRETAESLWDRAGGVRHHHMGDATDIKTIDVTNRAGPFSAPEYVLQSEGFVKVITKRYVGPNQKPLDVVSATMGTWETDPRVRGAAVDAQYNGFHALRYFSEVHKRRGLDGWRGNLVLVVHDNVGNEKGTNAHHSHSDGRFIEDDYLHFGDGNFLGGGDWLPFSAAFDVVVHECAHAVTAHSSGLVYRGESGALNESFSDVMAASAEEWFETKDPARNFLIGERFTKSGKGLRDMVDPASRGLPAHVRMQKHCAPGELPEKDANDYCYVHSSSSIPNRAFSLMTVGGVHSSSHVSVAKGIGWPKARELWYRTFTALRPQSTFLEAALAQVSEASRQGPEILQTVACAWHAVGVFALNAETHPALVGLACPTAPKSTKRGSTCAGVESGAVCNENAPFSAYICLNGTIAGGAVCADGSKRCKKAAPDDFTATVGSDGWLVCE